MSELINQGCSVPGKVPSGLFNSLFDLTGAWLEDAKETKHLAFDGNFICLYNLHLRASPLILRDEVKKAVPPNWDPVALARLEIIDFKIRNWSMTMNYFVLFNPFVNTLLCSIKLSILQFLFYFFLNTGLLSIKNHKNTTTNLLYGVRLVFLYVSPII